MNQALCSKEISALLDRPMRVLTYDSIDSTNNEAKRLAADLSGQPTLIAAELQTAGRGRLGRSFYSPAQTGLYMSILLCPNAPLSEWITITSAAAVAVSLAIEELSGLRPSIKWVNDLYLGDRKVCGILTEAVTDPTDRGMKHLIVGIGVNLSTVFFPEELASRAASLYRETIPPFTRNALAAAIANHLFELIDGLSKRTWLPLYRERAYLDGKAIIYYENGQAYTALAVGIDECGGLIVEDETGSRRTLTSGEVTVRVT